MIWSEILINVRRPAVRRLNHRSAPPSIIPTDSLTIASHRLRQARSALETNPPPQARLGLAAALLILVQVLVLRLLARRAAPRGEDGEGGQPGEHSEEGG